MKYLIYARVSPRGSDYEGETSINMQIQYCKDYVKFHKGEVVKVIYDEFQSGKDIKRPGLQDILAELESGNAEWDCLAVYKLSRLTRSLRDGSNIFDKLFHYAKGFVSVTESLDFSSPAGRAMLGVMQVFNQFEREQTAENTRNKMVSIAQKGLWPSGCPPFGYKRGEKGDNKLYVDDRKATILKDIFSMYDGNFNTIDIVVKYKSCLSKQQILNCLRNKCYLGFIAYNGELYKGQHTNIIDPELFKRVQNKLPQKKLKTRPKAQKYPYLLTGLLRCKCGRYMTPESAKSGKYHYYRCTDNVSCRYRVSAPKVEKAALTTVRETEISEKCLKKIVAAMEAEQQAVLQKHKPELTMSMNALKETKIEREKIYRLLIDSEVKSSNFKYLDDRLAQLNMEVETITQRINDLNKILKPDINVLNFATNIVEQVKSFSKALEYSDNDPYVKRQAMITNIEKIQADQDGNYLIMLNYRSSSNCQVWQPTVDLVELMGYRFTA